MRENKSPSSEVAFLVWHGAHGMPNTLEQFAFWIGLISLILALPLAVLGNLISPYVKNWYAEKSVHRTEKRICSLKSQLEKYRNFLHSPTVFIAYVIERFIKFPCVIFSICSVLSLIVLFYEYQPKVHLLNQAVDSIQKTLSFVILSTVVFSFAFIWKEVWRITNFEDYEKLVQSQIEELQNSLSEKRKSTS